MNPQTKDLIDYIFRYILALVVIIGLIIVIVFMFTHNISGIYTDTITLCIGALIGSYSTIISYEWGSSKGSSDKTTMLHNSTPIIPEKEN